MEIKNYDNLFLPAKDMEKSKEFYTQILGLKMKFEFEDKGMVAYKVGDEEPAIILKDISMHPDAQATIWLEVENVKAIYEQLRQQGILFLSEPFKIKTGWAAEFTDPSGNRLGLTDYDSY